jgi:hypothetical protein
VSDKPNPFCYICDHEISEREIVLLPKSTNEPYDQSAPHGSIVRGPSSELLFVLCQPCFKQRLIVKKGRSYPQLSRERYQANKETQ